MPRPSLFVAQLAISAADRLLASGVFYVLLPDTVPHFVRVLGMFLLAQIAGLVSNIPGGLGVFDAVALLVLAPFLPSARILGALLAYRGIYLVLPLVVALVVVLSRETVAWLRHQIERG